MRFTMSLNFRLICYEWQGLTASVLPDLRRQQPATATATGNTAARCRKTAQPTAGALPCEESLADLTTDVAMDDGAANQKPCKTT